MIQKRSKVLWFTGLSGSGKTTIAEGTYQHLIKNGKKVKILDGDKIRGEIHYNLGFTKMDIEKNNKKIAELCIDLISSYDFIIVPIISPFSYLRKKVRAMIGLGFYEIYIQASLTKVINRDVKGLYKKALRNEINNFIGIDSAVPFMPPKNPDLVIDTETQSEYESIQKLINFIEKLK